MLRVTVELLPFGDRSRARALGVITIANDGTGDEARGSYDVDRYPAGMRHLVWGDPVAEGRVEDHARRQSVWALVRKAIDATFRSPRGEKIPLKSRARPADERGQKEATR